MANKLTSSVSIIIDAPVSHVWQALTDPALIKEYLFGTNTRSDWKKNSSITYTGEWEGKK
ncbi:MAG TPA: ATPase, partial [Sphingobacteriaceae bacterium]|nr:ATPase [Sphingobacteriaceae bacterium]